MKRSYINKQGKVGRANAKANKILDREFRRIGTEFCEVCPILHKLGHLDWQCMQSTTFAHRHERLDYRHNLDKLHDYNQVIKACIKAHKFIDENKDIREQVFLELRGEDNLKEDK